MDKTKPTRASVTDVPCTCNYLQSSANNPNNPIEFEERTNEFQFRYQDPRDDSDSSKAMLTIFHCPFCGGAAPRSKRQLLYAVIPHDEEERLANLLTNVRTLDDALSLLGTPDHDCPKTCRLQESDNSPPRISRDREFRYEKLSKVADVLLIERDDGSAYWTLIGKYVGNS